MNSYSRSRSIVILAGCCLVASYLVLKSPAVGHAESEKIGEVFVGASLALTGKLAYTGVSQQRGLELAAEDINARGGIDGRTVKVVIEDNAGDPKQAVLGVKKLLEADKASMLFVSFSHITQAIKDYAKERDVVVMYAAAINQPAKESRHFFRDWADADTEGRATVRFLLSRGQRAPAYVGEESEGCANFLASAKDELANGGKKLVAEDAYSPGEVDFRSLLVRLRAKAPDSLIMCTWRDEATIMPQLKESGLIGVPTYHVLAPLVKGGDTPAMRRLFEENHGVSIWIGFVGGEQTPVQQQFSARFVKKYGEEPSMEAVLAYDDLNAFATSATSCMKVGNLTADCAATELAHFRAEGIGGLLAFDGNRLSTRKDLFITVQADKWVLATPPMTGSPAPTEHS